MSSWLHPGWRIAAAALAWLAGLAWQLQQPRLWPAGWCWALLCAALAVAALALGWPVLRRRGAGLLLLMAALALAAMASTTLRADARLAQRLAPALEGQDLQVTGIVATMPQIGVSGTRFVFEVEQALWQQRPVALPPRLALGWYRGWHDEAVLADPRSELRAGQRWQLPLRLKRPHGAMNPQGFDAELWWFEQDLGATGYVRVAAGGVDAQRLADGVGHPVERLRQTLREAIARQVGEGRVAGVLAALVVGDQAAIERDDWELFRQTGVAHLMSISGVHITMFAWLAGLLVMRGWRHSGRLMLWLPAPQAGRCAGLLLAAAYALLAGWGVPAQRTVLMLGITVALRGAGVRWPWLLVLLVAAVAVTLADPWALLQPGFWMSFTAVALLMASEPVTRAAAAEVVDRGADALAAPNARHGPARWLAHVHAYLHAHLHGHLRGHVHGHLRAQVVATLGLAPLSLMFFQQLSLVGFVANLVAIPFVTLIVTPLALLGALLPVLWSLAGWAVQVMVAGLSWLAAWPFAVWAAPAAPLWGLVCGLAGAVVAVLPLPWALRWLALPLLLPLLWPATPRPGEGRFELVVADVGQGTAVLLRTRHHLLVYDTGPQYSAESDAGQRVLLPLLRARGERQVDALVLSHRDGDHVGGAASLMAALPVRALHSSLAAEHPLRALGVPHRRCEDGQSWVWDGVRFEMLHPAPADFEAARKPNALSCVLRVVDAAGSSLLLTGDIERAQEAALLQRHGTALASTLLLVPHHGSRTSSSEDFLDAVHPELALVQAGYRSRFGHPAPDVLARYAARRIEVVRSDQCGAWLWQDGAAACTRDLRRRYWHWVAPAGGDNAGADVAVPVLAGEERP